MAKNKVDRSQSKPGGVNIGRADVANEEDRLFGDVRRSIHEVIRMLMLHRWMFFIPFCLVTSGAFIASLRYPRTYTASTSFERRNDPVMMNLPMSSGAASFKYFRNTMVQDLTSVEIVAEAVEHAGLISDLERDGSGELTTAARKKRDSMARGLAGTLSVSTVSPSELVDLIKITYTGPDPNVGRKLADGVKKAYIRRTMKWIQDFLVSQRDYFQKDADAVAAQLNEAKRAETQLRLDTPSANPGDPSSVAIKQAQLEMEERDLSLRRREYEAELAGLRQLLASLGSDVPASADLIGPPVGEGSVLRQSAEAMRLGTQIAQLDRQIQTLRETRGMTDQHPEVQDMLASRTRLAQQLDQLGTSDAPEVFVSAPTPVAAPQAATSPEFIAERARLLVQIAAQEAKLKDVAISLKTNAEARSALDEMKNGLFDKQQAFAEAASEVARHRERLSQLEHTIGQIEPAINAIDQNRLLQFSEGGPARGSSIPISPKASTIVLLALAAGIAAGIVFVLLAELFDNVYRSSGQVARSLGLPLLEAIDEIVTGTDRRR